MLGFKLIPFSFEKLLCIFAVATLTNCTGIAERMENKGILLNKIGEKRIKIDSLTSNIPQDIQIHKNDEAYIFALLNAPKNEIQLFNFQLGDLIEKKPFDENFFGQISDFYIHTLDSIFVSSITKKSAWLVDRDNQILQTFKLNETIGSSLSIGNENIIFSNGKLIVSTQVAIFDSKGIEEAPLVFVFDVQADAVTTPVFEYLTYPNIYEDPFSPELGLYYNAFDKNSNTFYHGFSASNLVYSFDLENYEIKSIEVRPDYKFEIKNSTQADTENINTRQYYYYSNYNYGYLLVVPIKNILIRTFYYPKKNLEENTRIQYDDLKPKFPVFSDLDSGDFLGQFILTDKQNEGLMFSLNGKLYINKIQDNEDEIVFEIFDFID
jgi:hypothetical protein